MRTVVLAAVGLVGGFLTGVATSEVVGIIGLVFAGQPVGLTFLPLYLAIAGAVAVPLVDRRMRRSSHTGNTVRRTVGRS